MSARELTYVLAESGGGAGDDGGYGQSHWPGGDGGRDLRGEGLGTG